MGDFGSGIAGVYKGGVVGNVNGNDAVKGQF